MKRQHWIEGPDGKKYPVPIDLYKAFNLNHLRLTNKAMTCGPWQLPEIVCQTDIMPNYIALTTQPGEFHLTPRTAVASFVYDDKGLDSKDGLYNAIYYDDKEALAGYKEKFDGVKMFIMPDLTIAGDLDTVEVVYRLKKMRVIALWLILELKAVVIPFITFPSLETVPFALNGYEDCDTVAFSTKGAMQSASERACLEQAVKYTVDSLPKLKHIVVYDVCGDGGEKARQIFKYAIDRGIDVVIPDNSLKRRNTEKKGGNNADE